MNTAGKRRVFITATIRKWLVCDEREEVLAEFWMASKSLEQVRAWVEAQPKLELEKS